MVMDLCEGGEVFDRIVEARWGSLQRGDPGRKPVLSERMGPACALVPKRWWRKSNLHQAKHLTERQVRDFPPQLDSEHSFSPQKLVSFLIMLSLACKCIRRNRTSCQRGLPYHGAGVPGRELHAGTSVFARLATQQAGARGVTRARGL